MTSRACKDCGQYFEARPRQRQCMLCKELKKLYAGIWSRLIYQEAYRDVPYEDTVSWHEFLKWGHLQLAEFFKTEKEERPSIDRVDPSRGYSLGNIRIIGKRRNCGRRSTNHFQTAEAVYIACAFRRQRWTLKQIASYFNCSIHPVWYLFKKRKFVEH